MIQYIRGYHFKNEIGETVLDLVNRINDNEGGLKNVSCLVTDNGIIVGDWIDSPEEVMSDGLEFGGAVASAVPCNLASSPDISELSSLKLSWPKDHPPVKTYAYQS